MHEKLDNFERNREDLPAEFYNRLELNLSGLNLKPEDEKIFAEQAKTLFMNKVAGAISGQAGEISEAQMVQLIREALAEAGSNQLTKLEMKEQLTRFKEEIQKPESPN